MSNLKRKMIKDCEKMITDAINSGVVTEGEYSCELHHEIFNADDFEVYTQRAIDYLGGDSFEAIETIKDYEENNFGEVTTDFSDPCGVLNMYCYIIGEEILQDIMPQSGILTQEELEEIKESLK